MNTEYGLKETLANVARAKGVCAEGYAKILDAADKDGLIEHYTANPDWCLERDFPTLGVLKAHFSDIEDKGVYVGKTFHGETLNEKQAYVLHNCRGTIKTGLNVEKGIIPMFYMANGCRLRIVGTGDIEPRREIDRSIVPVYTFGKNDVSARDNRYVVFNRYANDMI